MCAGQVTGLDTKLDAPAAMVTVFVPVNTAFDALAQQLNSSVPAVLAETDMLAQVRLLLHHSALTGRESHICCAHVVCT